MLRYIITNPKYFFFGVLEGKKKTENASKINVCCRYFEENKKMNDCKLPIGNLYAEI